MDVLLRELNELKSHIGEEELNRARNALKFQVLSEMECAGNRLEEVARNYLAFGGNLNFHKYCERIDAVTAHDINSVSAPLSLSRQPRLYSRDLQQSLSKEVQSTSSPT
jgi:predicted Zn-dependent peptidase